jgi:Pyridoxamine 5'-phosphate oxidase
VHAIAKSWDAAILTDVPGSWQDLELGAPEIARLGMDRINAAHIALLGTVRHDGSPRISPIEPYFARGQLLVGAMAWSKKAADLARDPRFVLHTAVTGPDSGEGELKLYGSAIEASSQLRGATPGAWWSAWAPDKAIVFSLRLDQAVFIEWAIEHGLMTVHRWSPESGYRQTTRGYP